jgi:hypothetical protein
MSGRLCKFLMGNMKTLRSKFFNEYCGMGGAIPVLQPSTFELGSTYSETSASRTRRPPVLLVYGANVEAERCQQACGYPTRKPWFPPYEAHASGWHRGRGSASWCWQQ